MGAEDTDELSMASALKKCLVWREDKPGHVGIGTQRHALGPRSPEGSWLSLGTGSTGEVRVQVCPKLGVQGLGLSG